MKVSKNINLTTNMLPVCMPSRIKNGVFLTKMAIVGHFRTLFLWKLRFTLLNQHSFITFDLKCG